MTDALSAVAVEASGGAAEKPKVKCDGGQLRERERRKEGGEGREVDFGQSGQPQPPKIHIQIQYSGYQFLLHCWDRAVLQLQNYRLQNWDFDQRLVTEMDTVSCHNIQVAHMRPTYRR